jgi:GDPmannose 4,6-dehydratase
MLSEKRALIVGISGQDGAYLARHLLRQGYCVFGSSRDAQRGTWLGLERLGLRDQVQMVSMTLTDFRSVLQALVRVEPHEVYNLAGQSSVGLSFEIPVETLESIAGGTLHLLEAIRFLRAPIRFYNACSSECFGDTDVHPADEQTRFRPRSPYAVAKAAAFWEVANYREAYDLFACSGILSNHESPLRPERYVTQKVIIAACRIAAGQQTHVELGDISIARDWGWAPEYVEAMHRMLQQESPDDYLVATGETHRLEDFVATAFATLGLDWRQHVRYQESLRRPTEIQESRLNPAKANTVLGWSATMRMPDVVRAMIDASQNARDLSR